MKKILISGSSGMIGTRLCEKLTNKHGIVGLDKTTNVWSDSVEKITVKNDIAKDNIQLDGIDNIVHLAANARVYELVKNPLLAKENIDTTFNMLEFARKNDIKKFVFASSREVYGNSGVDVHKEEDVRIERTESPYSSSKLSGESIVRAYNQCYGIDFVILRFSNVYGMYDDSDRVIPLFIRNILNNKDLVVFGENKLLDFTHIDDCVAGIEKVIDNFDAIKNNVFNLATGTGTKITEIATLLKNKMSSNNNIIIQESRTGEVVRFVADISKIKEMIGFSPEIGINEGIEKTVSWYKNYYSNQK